MVKCLSPKQNPDPEDPGKRWVWQCVPVAPVLGDSMGTGRSPKLIDQAAWLNPWASGPVRDPVFKTNSGRDWRDVSLGEKVLWQSLMV